MDYSAPSLPRVLRDFGLALITIWSLYALAFVSVWPLQLPGYLLLVGFDVLEGVVGSALTLDVPFDIAFALYLVVLAAGGAVVAASIRARLGDTDWTDSVAGTLIVLGTLVVSLVAVAFVQGGASFVPLATIATTGLVLVGLGSAVALTAREYQLNVSISRRVKE